MDIFIKLHPILLPLFLILLSSPSGENARILFLVPISTTSETHFFEPIINKLSTTGHHVTSVTSVKSQNKPENVTEIIPFRADKIFEGFGEISADIPSLMFFDMAPFAEKIDSIYENPEFQKLVMNETFDLVFSNMLFVQGFYGLIHKYQAPYILINSFTVSNYLYRDNGLYSPVSTIPNPLSDYTDIMNFKERVHNFILDVLSYLNSEFVYIPMLEKVYRKHLGEDLPSVKEIQKNASLIMTNTHFTSTYHRPILPDAIEIGGAHCKDPKPLPKDLENFVSSTAAPEGFIYISFGTVLKGSTLPEAVKTKILNVFSRLKQRVIWKWETETMENLPSNVMLKKWLPQQDILGHKNIHLFISHAGLLSTQQTIYHGVPVLFFPVFFDQQTNAKFLSEQQGVGLKLDLFACTEEEFENSVRRILNEPEFKERAKTLSAVFKDQMNSPIDRAVFWTNHVLKFKGAPHLRSSARNVHPLQFHSVDVVAFLITILLTGIFVLSFAFRKLRSMIVQRKEKSD